MRVYKYGLRRPVQNEALVHDQIKAAHHYRNKLVELEQIRRNQIRDIIDAEDSVQAATAVVKEAFTQYWLLHDQLAKQNAQKRSRNKADQSLRQQVTEAKAHKNKCMVELRKIRYPFFKVHKKAIATIDKQHNEAAKDARASCGVYWGTYLVVEDAMKRSVQDTSFWDGVDPDCPHFVSFKGTGRVSVQLQKDTDGRQGLASERVFGDDRRLQIDPIDEAAWLSPIRGERRRKSRTVLRLRVGSEGRDPIWAEWPMVMHRPLPDKSRIKRVTVNFRKIGPREEWTADFFVDDRETPHARNGAEGKVALDVGWRLFDDGSVRATCWYGHDQQTGEFRLSAALMGALKKADELKSTRDKNRNCAQDELVTYFRKPGHEMPEWMRKVTGNKNENPTNAQACAYLQQWKASARLAALTKRWKQEGTAPHQDQHDKLEEWRYHDYHLWRWESSQRKKAERRRKDQYRNFAYELAQRYRVLVLEDFRLTKLIKTRDVDEKADNETSRHNRKLTAISELRDVLRNAFEKSGEVRLVKPQNTTRICAACGAYNKFDAATNLEHRCTACGELWDQDHNASKVIYQRDGRANGTKGTNGGARRKRANRTSVPGGETVGTAP